ncbi:MAG TPA: hypothetical protein QGH84_03980 [Rhodospirillales bacterium]|nr:hypothetical protein [Rhodospirillales bacterium]
MDHLNVFKTMPVRRLVMLAFLGLGAALLAVVWGAWFFWRRLTERNFMGRRHGSVFADPRR